MLSLTAINLSIRAAVCCYDGFCFVFPPTVQKAASGWNNATSVHFLDIHFSPCCVVSTTYRQWSVPEYPNSPGRALVIF